MSHKIKILILEDNPTDVELILEILKNENLFFEPFIVSKKDKYIETIIHHKPDIILSDFTLDQFNGMEALDIANGILKNVPFLVITGTLDDETAVKCIKKGAWDYVIKEHLVRLGPAVRNALKLKEQMDEKKRTEDALRINEEKFRRLAERSFDVIFTIDMYGNLTYVSPSIERILGYKPQEVIGNNLKMLVQNTRIVVNLLKKISQGQHAEHLSVEVQKKDQSLAKLEINISPVLFQNKPVGAQGHARDITARKQSEDAIMTRDDMLEMAGEIVEGMKQSHNDLSRLHESLGKLAETLNVSRLYVTQFINYNNEEGKYWFQWISPKEDPVETSFVKNGNIFANAFIPSIKPLDQGDVIQGKIFDFNETEQVILNYFGIKSLMIVPIFVDKKCWGVLGCDDNREERSWTFPEIEIFKLIAGVIEYMIRNSESLQSLALEKQNTHMIMDNIPIPVIQMDFTEAVEYFSEYKIRISESWETFFDNNPDKVLDSLKKIKYLEVNKAGIKLYQAYSKDELMENLGKMFCSDSMNCFKEAMHNIISGQKYFEIKTIQKNLKGDFLQLLLKWNILDVNHSILVTVTIQQENKEYE